MFMVRRMWIPSGRGSQAQYDILNQEWRRMHARDEGWGESNVQVGARAGVRAIVVGCAGWCAHSREWDTGA